MELIEKAKQIFDSAIESFHSDLVSVRTNRPSPKLLEDIQVSYMEQTFPIKHLGSVSIEPPRDLAISVWDQGAVTSVSKAISDAGLGVSVSEHGSIIRVKLPELTQERKQELAKVVKTMAEEARIKMRNDRDEIQKQIKSIKDEDESFRAKDKLQDLVNEFNKKIDELVANKTQEILE